MYFRDWEEAETDFRLGSREKRRFGDGLPDLECPAKALKLYCAALTFYARISA